MKELPHLPGTYVLLLDLPIRRKLIIGALGEIDFPAGKYVYCGSALGPGGLRARLGRHLAGTRTIHWHIDYLRRHAHAIAFGYALARPGAYYRRDQEKHECQWSQIVAGLPQSTIPALHFGASDCTSTCLSHMVALGPNGDLESVRLALSQVTPRLLWQIMGPC